jgi:hypothetical protein
MVRLLMRLALSNSIMMMNKIEIMTHKFIANYLFFQK